MEIANVSLKWDKTTVMVAYDDLPLKKIDLERRREWIDACMHHHWIGKVSWGASKKASLSHINLRFPCGTTLYVQWGKQAGMQRIWLEFNPSKATAVGMEWIKFHIHQLFENGVDTLVKFGVVTHGEFAIDVVGAVFSELWFFDEFAKSGDNNWLEKGTFYLGSDHSDRNVKCYDKAKEMLEKHKLSVPTMLRLEALLQKKNKFPLSQFSSLLNPFETLIVVSRSAMAGSKHPLIKQLVSKIKKLKANAQEIYQHFSTYHRKLLTKALRKLQPTWWNPQEIWKALPQASLWIEALLKFNPSVV